MDNDTWLASAQAIAPVIRKMPVIRDHPDWWVVMTLDGFKSHVNVTEALKVFTTHKIRVVKEEARTLHVN